ncbi:Polycystin cation channel-domain-containing protein [Baffinella frigidus]|nr:Polycystin cation channel-domain-containing protein [Cryptophyta sp. CCMP2293]
MPPSGGAAYARIKRIKERLKKKKALEGGGGGSKLAHEGTSKNMGDTQSKTSIRSPRSEKDPENPEEDIYPVHVNLKRTIDELERWPGLVKDYTALTMYFLFCCLFMSLVVFQLDVPMQDELDHMVLDVPTQYELDHMVRHRLLDQEGALANVAGHGDVFSYLLKEYDSDTGDWTEDDGGVFGTLFEAEHYNGDPIIGEDVGFLFSFNKLIGGVQLKQIRGTEQKCSEGRGFSNYNLFYETCYEDEPQVFGDSPEEIERSKFGDRETIDGSQTYTATVAPAFQWDPIEQGFTTFLSLADGSSYNKKRLEDLNTMRWLDKRTKQLEIKFIFYNGNFGKFTFAKIILSFDKGGIYRPYDPESAAVQQAMAKGIQLKIGSLNMEPYLKEIDFVRLAFEVFILVASFVREQVENAMSGHFLKRWSPFNVLDAINYTCNILFIYMRIMILRKIIEGYVKVPVNDYQRIFEEVYEDTQNQLTVNFVSILLCILRFFKYYQFQPRLQIVNKTMGAAVVHLYHFMLIFGIILCGFAVLGHLNFGKQSRDFVTIIYSIQTLWESLFGNIDLGPTIGNTDLGYINIYMGQARSPPAPPHLPRAALVFFISWMFIAFLVLWNVFIGILMDAYGLALEEGKAAAEKRGKEQPDAVGDDVAAFMSEISTVLDRNAWKFNREALLHSLKLLDKHLPDPEVEFDVYQKELKVLQKQQQMLAHRIQYLETMTSEDIQHEPFHDLWKQKTVTINQIADVLPRKNVTIIQIAGVPPRVSESIKREEIDEDNLEIVWSNLLSVLGEDGDGQDARQHADHHEEKILKDLVPNRT